MSSADGMSRPPWRPLLALLVVSLGVSAAFAYLVLNRPESSGPVAIVEAPSGPFRGNQLPDEIAGSRAPDFRLADASGGELDTRKLAGRPYAVTFLYTRCPDVCPVIAQEIRQSLELLGPRADDVQIAAVSVDPRNDTREAVRAWLERQGLPDNFRYAIGETSQLRPVWDDYYAAPQTPARAESSHSASIWLIDADGRIRTKFSAGAPVAPADLAHDFGVLLDEAQAELAPAKAPGRSG